MSNWSAPQGRRVESIGLVSAATMGTSVITAATSSTEGAWATIGAFSTPMSGFIVFMSQDSPVLGANVVPSGTMDIALGDGSTTLVSDFFVGEAGTRSGQFRSWYFPLRVPSSVNILIRMRAETTVSLTNIFSITGISQGFVSQGFYNLEAVNVSASAASTTVDPGAVGFAKGAATSLTTGGLPRDYKGFFIYPQRRVSQGSGSTVRGFIDIRSDTGVLVNDLPYTVCSVEDCSRNWFGPIWMTLTKGMPIQAVMLSNISASPARTTDIVFYGIY